MATQWLQSKREFERACEVIPGGVNSPARAFGAVGGHPILIEQAQGAVLTDIEGNQYIDYIGSWGPMILGHRHPRVIQAVEQSLAKGMSYGAPTLLETELAQRVVQAVPSCEQVRMVNSGTEASMSAIRLARGFTGRDKIIKIAGCYHGHVDSLLVQAGSAATTLGTPSSPGVPAGCTADTLVLDYNDLDAVKQSLAEHKGQIAAVILEPVAGNMGLVRPAEGYLAGLNEATSSEGTLLILDEVMTGFRLSYAGAQGLFNVQPDLTVFGKVIGGGMPVGAYGGRKDVMQSVSPCGPVFQAGTLSGNPLAMASGIATLDQLKEDAPYGRLEEKGQRLEEGLKKVAQDAGVEHTVARVGSMLTLFFNPEPVTNYTQATKSDTKRFGQFFWEMMKRGIYLPCSQYEAMFISDAHTNDQIDQTIQAAKESLAAIV